ncbi:MAG: cytochrome c biogenesis protein CcdA [Oscillospiraceae bacterium]
MIHELVEMVSVNVWLAPLIALAAGLLTSLTPCGLSAIPIVMNYVGGTGQKDPKRAFRMSLTFALGSTFAFAVLGMIASLAGILIEESGNSWWFAILGVIMVIMALQSFEVIHIIPSSCQIVKSTKKGYIGAFIAGILGGLCDTPCVMPVLMALLAFVAGSGNFFLGIGLLLIFSVGHGILSVVAGTSAGFVLKLSENAGHGSKFHKIFDIISGSLILLIGIYFFYLTFTGGH